MKKATKKKYCLSKKRLKNMCRKTCKKRNRRNNKKIQYGCKKLFKGGSGTGIQFIDSFIDSLRDDATSAYNTVLGNDQIPRAAPMYDQFRERL